MSWQKDDDAARRNFNQQFPRQHEDRSIHWQLSPREERKFDYDLQQLAASFTELNNALIECSRATVLGISAIQSFCDYLRELENDSRKAK